METLSVDNTLQASSPTALSVTVYRDPYRAPDQKLDRNWPRGFAMISETRRVVLPPGESTIRFAAVRSAADPVTMKDPAGNFSEYYSDMDCIPEDAIWTPGRTGSP